MKEVPEGTVISVIPTRPWTPIRMAEVVYVNGDEEMGFVHLRDCLTGEIFDFMGQSWLKKNINYENMSIEYDGTLKV